MLKIDRKFIFKGSLETLTQLTQTVESSPWKNGFGCTALQNNQFAAYPLISFLGISLGGGMSRNLRIYVKGTVAQEGEELTVRFTTPLRPELIVVAVFCLLTGGMFSYGMKSPVAFLYSVGAACVVDFVLFWVLRLQEESTLDSAVKKFKLKELR